MKTLIALIYIIGISGTAGLIAGEIYNTIKMRRLVRRVKRGPKPW